MVDDETLYLPASNVTDVPEDEPGNESGFGLFPETVMVKSEGLLVPPVTLVTSVIAHKNAVGTAGDAVKLLAFGQFTCTSQPVPEQPEEYDLVYQSTVDDET